MDIGSNKYQFWGKIIVLSIALIIVTCKLYFRISIDTSNAPVGALIFGGFVFTMLALLIVIMTLQLFLFPIGVFINEDAKMLTLKFFMGRVKMLALADIREFSTTTLVTKSTRYEGISIQTTNGKQYILGDINLNDYKPVQVFLEKNQVSFNGHLKFKMLPYLVRNFKS